MIYVILLLLGLCLGSFVNAFVWRLHEQELESIKKKPSKKYLKQLSISKGHSMCPHCKHALATKDLLPVLSWLSLKGKCRYCTKPISAQYPLVELAMTGLFITSYIWWPVTFNATQIMLFILWLTLSVGLLALTVYDLHWKLLPNKIIYPLGAVAIISAVVTVISATHPLKALLNEVLAVFIGGGIFYVLFQVSNGKWIGGGDVKLGWLLGLVVGTPARSLLVIFLASFLGSLISIPLLASHRLKRTSTIPFGPFLIVAAIIVQLFGHSILFLYQRTFFPFTV